MNTSATKELLIRAKNFLKQNNLQGYFQALDDAVSVNRGMDEEDDPEAHQIEFEKLDQRLRG